MKWCEVYALSLTCKFLRRYGCHAFSACGAFWFLGKDTEISIYSSFFIIYPPLYYFRDFTIHSLLLARLPAADIPIPRPYPAQLSNPARRRHVRQRLTRSAGGLSGRRLWAGGLSWWTTTAGRAPAMTCSDSGCCSISASPTVQTSARTSWRKWPRPWMLLVSDDDGICGFSERSGR